jgi:transcriptional regulator with XRE-family HTH domain
MPVKQPDNTGALRLAKTVREERGRQGLTQVAAAARGGTSPQTWKNVEAGQRPPRDFTLAKVDLALRWPTGTAHDILGGGKPPAPGSWQPVEPAAEPENVVAILARIEAKIDALFALVGSRRGTA